MNYEHLTNMDLLRQLIQEAGAELEIEAIAKSGAGQEILRRRGEAKKKRKVWDVFGCFDGAF